MPRRVHGYGRVPNEFFFCGEKPGWEEDKAGRPFVGKTGQEMGRHLDGTNLPAMSDVFVANLYREFRGKDYIYTTEDLAVDEQDLLRELRQVKPRIIVPLGRHATRWFLGDVDMDSTQGIPWLLPEGPEREKLSFLDSDVVVFPIVHPAAGFQNPEMSPYVVAGFQAFATFLDGETEPRILFNDPYPEPQYEEITTVDHLARLLRPLQRRASPINVSIDTEGSPARPWSLQFSVQPGTAYTIRHRSTEVVAAFGDYLTRARPRVTYHSALHDLSMMRALKLPMDMPFDDTMVMSYLLQLEPQGLKALCVRHCGMKMQSYDDVLGDASQRLALDYFAGLWDVEQLDWEAAREDAFWQEIDKGRRLSVYPKLPKTSLHKAVERALRSKDSRKLWGNQIEDIQVAAYNRLGPIPEATLDHVPLATAVHYGSRDADGTTRVRRELEPRVDSFALKPVYELELGTYPLIERMSYVGLKPDLEHFATLSERLQGELDYLQIVLDGTIGDGFNANSGDQTAEYVFDGLGLEGVKKTSSGRFSTNDKILEALEREHPEFPILSTIREYREVYKLKNTFVDRLPDFVHRWPFDGRVHATFRTTRVVTGRLAASDPNLLAMPKHGKFAKDFRKGWIAEAGHILTEWDLSQIELRVLAHLSQDPVLLAVYRGELKNPDGSKVDLHANLAQRIFGGKPSDHAKGTGRLAAKAINFGLPMGMTYKGLAVELRKNGVNVSEDDAQKWIDETFGLYKRIPVYQNAMAAEAKRQGFIRCLSGRIRYIGGINSRDERIREEARRFAFSTPVQEGAQWLMKAAETRLWAQLQVYWKRGEYVEPLVQIHDALTLETTPKLAPALHEYMVKNMTMTPKGFSVPVETSGDYGTNWAEMKEF
jgi:uracil-DNA glycosylase family 4